MKSGTGYSNVASCISTLQKHDGYFNTKCCYLSCKCSLSFMIMGVEQRCIVISVVCFVSLVSSERMLCTMADIQFGM